MMASTVSKQTRREVTEALQRRYKEAKRFEKSRILDEFVALSGVHRKHAIRVLSQEPAASGVARGCGRRVYDDAVKEALIVVWEASDRICGKRLKEVLPQFVEAMEKHGHLNLDPAVRERLLSASAATLDRLLRTGALRTVAAANADRTGRAEFIIQPG